MTLNDALSPRLPFGMAWHGPQPVPASCSSQRSAARRPSSSCSQVFAYQGHSMFLEVQSEMIDGRRFPTACRVAYSFITMVYTLTTTVAYGIAASGRKNLALSG